MSVEQPQIDRRQVTFEQAEGLEPLPSQLQPKEVSQQLRALLWQYIHRSLSKDKIRADYSSDYVSGKWALVLRDMHVFRFNRMVDDFANYWEPLAGTTRQIFEYGSYSDIFGWLQWVMRHPNRPDEFAETIDRILQHCRSAYRVIDQSTIVPLGSEEERLTIESALDSLGAPNFRGGRQHLKQATAAVSEGRYADSVRDSIHAVESVARTLTGKDRLSDALTELEKQAKMHRSMKLGFDKLYGWTSDEQGIRHPLLDEGDTNVTEADALFSV